MFKGNMIIHVCFMLILEFFLCYGVAAGLTCLIDKPDNQIKYSSDISGDGQIHKVLNLAGTEYITTYNTLTYDRQYNIKQNLKEMSIGYNYTVTEYKNIVWFVTWILYAISMFIFFIFVIAAHDGSNLRAAPPLCKVFDLFVSALPDNPIRTNKEKRKERVSDLLNSFKKYGGR